MITGYFLIEKTEFRWRGFAEVLFETLFYSLIVFILVHLATGTPVTVEQLLKTLTPIHANTWWFITAYLCLLLVAPFLSLLASKLSKRQYIALLAVLFVLVFEYPYGKVVSIKAPIVNFCFFYLLAGYLRLHGTPRMVARHSYMAVFAAFLLLLLPAILWNVLRHYVFGLSFQLIGSDRTFVEMFLSTTVFILFAKRPMEGRLAHIIAKAGPFMLGVYLIHCHPDLQPYIWAPFTPDAFSWPAWLLQSAFVVLFAFAIFFVCLALDVLRAKLFTLLGLPRFFTWVGQKMPHLAV